MPMPKGVEELELETPFATLSDWHEERRRWRRRNAGEPLRAWLARRATAEGKPTLARYVEECFGVRIVATDRPRRWRTPAHAARHAMLISDGRLYEGELTVRRGGAIHISARAVPSVRMA